MAITYSELPDEMKEGIEWEGITDGVWFNKKARLPNIVRGTAETLYKYFPDMKVSLKNSLFGVKVEHPEGGDGEITLNGRTLSDMMTLKSSEIYKNIYTSKELQTIGYRGSGYIIFERRDNYTGAKSEISRRNTGKLLLNPRHRLDVNLWPKNDGNKATLSNIIRDMEEKFKEQIITV